MYEVKENRRKLQDGTEITTYTRDVVSANILEVEAGTNGYQGGDTGHGSRTYFRISRMRPARIFMSRLSWTNMAAMVLKSPSAATASWRP
jgi:hypothetical protein